MQSMEFDLNFPQFFKYLSWHISYLQSLLVMDRYTKEQETAETVRKVSGIVSIHIHLMSPPFEK